MMKLGHLAQSGLPLTKGVSVVGTITRVGQSSPIFKIASLLFVSLTPLTLSLFIVSRTESSSTVYTPPPSYLPGHPLPQLAGENPCPLSQPYSLSCVVYVYDHKIYWYYQAGTRKIIRTVITAEENAIGDLILAWGTPIGFDQYGTSIVVSWGARSALLVTSSFQPYSHVRFIEYDLVPFKRSSWRGFGDHK